MLREQQKLVGKGEFSFGYSVAISGNTAVVGAPAWVEDLGTAYVFTRNAGQWTKQQTLLPITGRSDNNWTFGSSVAMTDDSVVVGSPTADVGDHAQQGCAYVFTRIPWLGLWVEQQRLVASDGAAGDFFGTSVAISADTVIIGVQKDDIGMHADQGSAYVFTRGGGVWTQQQKLVSSDGAASDEFGVSVAVSGESAIVGAHWDAVGGRIQQGSAYVFNRTYWFGFGIWAEQQKLVASDGRAVDWFGEAVALGGETAVVGSVYGDVAANADEGAAYVFTRSGGVWAQQQKLLASDGGTRDYFGHSIAISGDVLVASASNDVAANGNRGSAYVFTHSGGLWKEQQKLVPDDVGNHYFGTSVALTTGSVIVGDEGDLLPFWAGSAYVYADVPTPTAVGTGTLGAARIPRGVVLRWRAGGDASVLGYRVYREHARRSVLLTPRLLPARSSAAPRVYRFLDGAAPRGPLGYRLQLVRLDGSTASAGTANLR
jgi:hypothetical protein